MKKDILKKIFAETLELEAIFSGCIGIACISWASPIMAAMEALFNSTEVILASIELRDRGVESYQKFFARNNYAAVPHPQAIRGAFFIGLGLYNVFNITSAIHARHQRYSPRISRGIYII